MGISAEVLKALVAAGASAEMIVAAVEAAEKAEIAERSVRREKDARRQRASRLSRGHRVTADETADSTDIGSRYTENAHTRDQACASPLSNPTPSQEDKTLPSEVQKDGHLAVETLKSLEDLPDTAAAVHAASMAALQVAGFEVYPEYHIGDLGNGFGGRIDIVAIGPNRGRVAIELDARKPRRRSITKLRKFLGYRIVGLRGVTGEPEEDIHAVVRIDVRLAEDAERTDKRSVNRPLPVTAWHPGPAIAEFATQLGYSETAYLLEMDKMRDWAIAKGESKKDWDAAARNWLRRTASEKNIQPAPDEASDPTLSHVWIGQLDPRWNHLATRYRREKAGKDPPRDAKGGWSYPREWLDSAA